MKPLLLALFVMTSFTIILSTGQVRAAQVTLILRNIETDSFDEWRIKPGEKFTKSTGKLGRETGEYEQTWDIGDTGAKIRFWWAHLSGEVDATVVVNNEVVFQGHCVHSGDGRVRMIDTCSYPHVYKNSGGGPYLIDLPQCDTTRLSFAVSMLGERFGGAECLSANLLAHRLLLPR
jgi:hypothetical protein